MSECILGVSWRTGRANGSGESATNPPSLPPIQPKDLSPFPYFLPNEGRKGRTLALLERNPERNSITVTQISAKEAKEGNQPIPHTPSNTIHHQSHGNTPHTNHYLYCNSYHLIFTSHHMDHILNFILLITHVLPIPK